MVSSTALLRSSGVLAVTTNAGWVRIASSCGPLAWQAIGRHCRQNSALRVRDRHIHIGVFELARLLSPPPPPFEAAKTCMTEKSTPIPPLFKADSATLAFSATKDGKIRVTYIG
jgi:hypothetical protein